MKSTNKRIKLNLGKLVGFNQQKSSIEKPNLKAIKSMVGVKGGNA
jgi:hypothetical protein